MGEGVAYDELSDEALVKLSLQKDLEAFRILMDRYTQKLFFYVLRISDIREEEAEDIVQNVFLKAWRNLNGFDTDLKFSSWIYRIAHNEAISYYRQRKNRGEVDFLEFEEAIFEVPSQIDLGGELDQKINAELVQKILKKMREDYREVLVLRFFEDKNYDEIADILHKPAGTVATLLNRAKKEFMSLSQKSRIDFQL